MNTATKPSFNYESFDRQMEGFLSMSYLMIDEWDECTSEEMTSDLYSLCIKGARLCNMIDTDLALQQQDLTQSRHGKNQDYYLRLNEIMRPLSELIFKAMDEMKQQKTLKYPVPSLNTASRTWKDGPAPTRTRMLSERSKTGKRKERR